MKHLYTRSPGIYRTFLQDLHMRSLYKIAWYPWTSSQNLYERCLYKSSRQDLFTGPHMRHLYTRSPGIPGPPRSLYRISLQDLLARPLWEICIEELSTRSLYKTSMRYLYTRALYKISSQNLYERSLYKNSLHKTSMKDLYTKIFYKIFLENLYERSPYKSSR